MKLVTANDTLIIGTKETVPGTALASEFEADGTPIYDGETKIWWDDQKTVWSQGSRVYIDEAGEEYRFDELTVVADDEDANEEEEDDE